MTDINKYLYSLASGLSSAFGKRLLYIGLQGSFAREEATDSSDIDIFIILDELNINDMDIYSDIIDSIKSDNKACGFICAEEDIRNWNKLEICQIVHETKNIYGKLSDFVPAYSKDDVLNYIKLTAGNIYHILCHTYIHNRNEINSDFIEAVYKQVFYILQNLYWLKSEIYIHTGEGLLKVLQGNDLSIMKNAAEIKKHGSALPDKDFSELFHWCKHIINDI